MKSLTPAAVLAVALLAGGAASATTIGLPGVGNFSTTFDTFPSASFTGDSTPDITAGTFTSSLNFTSTGGLLLGGGDRIYSGGNATTIDISGTASSTIRDFQLVLKFTAPSVGSPADFYTVSLFNTIAPAEFIGTVTEGSNTFQIYKWSWTDLQFGAGSNFQITATGLADHVSLDAIQLNSVPEASTSILGALAAGAMLVRRRR